MASTLVVILRRVVGRAEETIDRVSVLSPIAIEILMVRNGEGQSSHVCVFSVKFLHILPQV